MFNEHFDHQIVFFPPFPMNQIQSIFHFVIILIGRYENKLAFLSLFGLYMQKGCIYLDQI